MTPKDKAEELVRKYYSFGLNNPAQSFSWYECKQFALIAVYELMKSHKQDTTDNQFYYWKEAKQEIKKLWN